MGKKMKYFGYGANSSAEMMKAIIGRKPKGYPAKLEGYELCIQKWEELSKNVRKRLDILRSKLKSGFKTYYIRATKGDIVAGKIWYITRKERDLVKNWEFWCTPINVKVMLDNGKMVKAETEMIENLTSRQVVNGINYPLFLNKREMLFEVALGARERYLKENLSR